MCDFRSSIPLFWTGYSDQQDLIENATDMKWVAMVGGLVILITGLFPDTLTSILAMI
ncbi:MAG TPA: hypothetical protein PK509_13175 [Catalimonadaceae bacterium]|nr:hypothetical protein [Catalimonadaceae bacterium]HOY96689.1 hypothetical protein [Catalimonadaceae bacterium]